MAKPKAPQSEAPAPIVLFPLDKIRVSKRLRAVDMQKAEGIAISMATRGQDSPILLTMPDADGFADLIFGGHRRAAAELLGWEKIEARHTAETDPLKLRLAEIDENLARAELTILDRALHMAERKRVWEELNPETKAGVAGAMARWHANAKFAFASDAAETLGWGRRTIENGVALAGRLNPDVIPLITGTWLADHGQQLEALSKQPPEKQAAIAQALLRGENPAATVQAAVAELEGHRTGSDQSPDPTAQQYEKLLKAWNRAGSKAREQFLKHIDAVRSPDADEE